MVLKVGTHLRLPDGRRAIVTRIKEGQGGGVEWRPYRWYERLLRWLLQRRPRKG